LIALAIDHPSDGPVLARTGPFRAQGSVDISI